MAKPQLEGLNKQSQLLQLSYSGLESPNISPLPMVLHPNSNEIFWSVVGFYPIHVMNDITFWQWLAVSLLPDKYVFKNIIGMSYLFSPVMWLWAIYFNITTCIYFATTFPVRCQFTLSMFLRALATHTSRYSAPVNQNPACATPIVSFYLLLLIPVRPFGHSILFLYSNYNILYRQSQYMLEVYHR